ncbi:MAG: hypothetical protein OEW98_00040 [Betaproteobacteria bacterium]|nr:hypothetical protein [Betaproteobacteria bacterium]
MTTPRAWDDGITWHLALTTPPSDAAVSVALAQRFTRDPNGRAESVLYELWSGAARRMAERRTLRAIGTQSWSLVLSAFPWSYIRVPKPPLIEVTGITYLDGDGVTQTLAASPADFVVEAPAGPTAQCASVWPLAGESWPATAAEPGAVQVAFTCGYDVLDQTAVNALPEDILAGMLLVLGEMFKQRSESVQQPNNTHAVIRAYDLWDGYRVY